MASAPTPLWTIDAAGLTVPTAAELIAQMNEEAAAEDVLGGEYLFHPEDPITQLLELTAYQLASVYQLIEAVNNSRDPSQAQGVLLRESGSLVGADIPQPTRSVITGRLVGNPGVTVPLRSIVKYLSTGDLWQTFASASIGAGGTVDVELESVEFAAVDAAAAGLSAWQIQTPVAGWTGFLSTAAADVGRAAATDAETREAIALAASGGAGAATYDSDVANVAAVDGVTHVALFSNRTSLYDAAQDLDGKTARFIVEGGRKQALFDAIAGTGSTSLNTISTGDVQGTSTRSDGTEISVSYSRPTDVPILVRVTISGDLPDVTDTTAIIETEVVLRAEDQDFGEPAIPAQYLGPVVAGFAENAVESITVEMRLDSGDPWVTTPLVLAQTERAVISADPRPAKATSSAEDPITAGAGLSLDITVDGGGLQNYVLIASHTTVASLITEIEGEYTDVEFVDFDGRLVIQTVSTGAASSLVLAGDLLTALGITAGTYGGTDSDITVVIT